LARKVLLEHTKIDVKTYVDELDQTLGEELLTPTKIYVPTVLNLIKRYNIKGIAHITGGGLPENLARILPRKVQAVIDINAWPVPHVFKMIKRMGKVDQNDMFETFNMGIGMVLVVDGKQEAKVMNYLAKQKEEAYMIGEVAKGKGEVIII